jgi:rhodanese-related sulfurtransferase
MHFIMTVSLIGKRIEKTIVIFVLILASIIPPIALYIFSNVPTVSSKEARDLLLSEPSNTLLIDVQEKQEFDRIHIQNSVNIPYDHLLKHGISNDQMAMMRGKTVLVVCGSGLASAPVTKDLRKNFIKAFNVKGGIDRWIADNSEPSAGAPSLLTREGGEPVFPFRIALSHEQWLAVLTGYGIKPLYTLLSLILIIILWKKKKVELVALKYAMIFFFTGENFCAANYLFFDHESYLFEYWHSLGMVLCLGMSAYALFEGLDRSVIHYFDPQKKCVFLGLCNQCIKYDKVSCALKRFFIFLCFSASTIALMPLFAKLKMISYNTEIWGTFYNYSHPVIYQVFEVRYGPIIGALGFASAALTLLIKKTDPFPLAKILFAGACGATGFSFFRFILFQGYEDNLVWMEFWEEITEFIFIAGLSFLLWLFRHSLLKE